MVRASLRGLLVLGLVVVTENAAMAQTDSPARLAPLPRQCPSPETNPTTAEKVSLGRLLFFDPRLSGDNRMSCATCHLPQMAFADARQTALGHDGQPLVRNTPTVLNIGFLNRFFWDGRATSLEVQALEPIQSPQEMHQQLDELEQELEAVAEYARQFRAVFGTQVTRDGIAKALAAFQRSLTTEPDPLDRFLAGDANALSEAAKRGRELFVGDAGCVRCHHGPMLTDQQFHRVRVTPGDTGLETVTGNKHDRYRFRTPPLRNVADTGPYMHDGSLKTLADVVAYYFRNVPATGPDGLTLDVEPLWGQSYSDISDLVAFLESLSGKLPESAAPTLP